MSDRPRGQAQPRGHKSRRKNPRTNRRLIYLTLTLMSFVGISYLYNHFLSSSQDEEEEMIVDKDRDKADSKIEKKEIKPPVVIPEVVVSESPYTFYEQLEKRTFRLFDDVEYGGAEIREDRVESFRPSFSLISTPLENDTNGVLDRISNDEVLVASTHSVYKSLQTGSFSSQGEANTLRKVLEAYGYKPRILKVTIDNKIIHRVQIGPFSRDELESVKVKLMNNKIDFFEVQ